MGEKPHGAVALAAAGVLSAFLGGGVCYFNKEDKQEPVGLKMYLAFWISGLVNYLLPNHESLNPVFRGVRSSQAY